MATVQTRTELYNNFHALKARLAQLQAIDSQVQVQSAGSVSFQPSIRSAADEVFLARQLANGVQPSQLRRLPQEIGF